MTFRWVLRKLGKFYNILGYSRSNYHIGIVGINLDLFLPETHNLLDLLGFNLYPWIGI